VNSFLSTDPNLKTRDTGRSERFLVAVIGPDDAKRESVVRTLDEFPQVDVSEFYSYPPKRGYLRDVLENPFNVVMIELDSSPEIALDLIEEAAEFSSAAILVYSEKADLTLALRCIKAGALEYIHLSLDPAALSNQIRIALASDPTTSTSEIRGGESALNGATSGEHRQNPPFWIPETLPENFCEWDAESGPEKQNGTSAEMETARVLSVELVEQSIEREAVVPPDWDWSQISLSGSNEKATIAEGKDIGKHESGAISTGFTSRTKNESDAVIESPLAEYQPENAIPGKRCRVMELGTARTQEADQELWQMFRSNVEISRRPKTLKRRKRIAAPIVIGIVLPLLTVMVGLLNPRVDSDAKQLISLGANSIRVQLNADSQK
jgi:DNA-binding NarL/FixJ family response regulator